MKKFLLLAGTAFVALSYVPVAHADSTTIWFVPGTVDLRAGPDSSFPVVQSVPSQAHMDLEGCLQGWSWCDVSYNGQRGWVSGHDIESVNQNKTSYVSDVGSSMNVPVISYNTATYWDSYYKTQPFYTKREQFVTWAPSASSSSADNAGPSSATSP